MLPELGVPFEDAPLELVESPLPGSSAPAPCSGFELAESEQAASSSAAPAADERIAFTITFMGARNTSAEARTSP